MNTIFSQNLKKLRLQKTFTQEQAAEALGVSAQTVSRWECNTTLPDVMILPEIARLYCVTVDDLFKEDSSAYDNYAQRLASVYEATHKPEDYLKAAIEFQKLKQSDNYSLEDCLIHGNIHTTMMCYCKKLAIKNYDHILDHFECVNDIDSGNKIYWKTRFQKIQYLFEIGKSEECILSQVAQWRKHPDNHMEAASVIYAYFYSGKYEEAYAHFTEVNGRFPDKWEIYDIGSHICRALKKYKEAIQCCDKAYELNTEYIDAKYSKAFCCEEMGDYKQAYHTWMEIIQSLKSRGYDAPAQREEKRAQECLDKINHK